MNWRINLFALSIYAMLCIIGGAVVFLGIRQWDRQLSQSIQLTHQNKPTTGSVPARRMNLPLGNLPTTNVPRAMAEADAELLENLLAQRNQQVSELRQDIQTIDHELKDLKNRYDEVIEMTEEWFDVIEMIPIGEIAASKSDLAEEPTEETVFAPDQLPTNREVDMQDELTEMALQLSEQEVELEFLASRLTEREAMLVALITSVMKPTAETLVPQLSQMLLDRRPEVRKWACEVIIALGPSAHNAEDALRLLLDSENEPEIKAAANLALDAIAD